MVGYRTGRTAIRLRRREHGFEQLPAVGTPEDRLAHALRMRHEPEHVLARPPIDARDGVEAAVGIGAFFDRPVARAVAQADEPFALEPAQRLLVGLVAPLAMRDGQRPHLARRAR